MVNVPPHAENCNPSIDDYYVPIEKASYDTSCTRYEKATECELRNSDTIILGGYRCHVKVEHYALVLRHKCAHTEEEKETRLYKGVNKICQIIICSHGGYISFDAIKWCIDENITVLMLDWRGSLIQVLTPKHPGNAKLIWQQYQATKNDVGLGVSIELVRRKVQAQLNTLKTLPILYEKRFSAEDTLENGLVRLRNISTTDALMKLEGKLASAYFNVFLDMPIKWPKSVAKTLPPHWLSITERTSPLSKNHGARWSINPFHAALNFAYALLEVQVLQSVIISGLEPTCGYLHAYEEGTNTLVFDLMEPFRANIDKKVLTFFRSTTFHRGDFYQLLNGECRLNEQLRRYILASCRLPQSEIDALISWLLDRVQAVV